MFRLYPLMMLFPVLLAVGCGGSGKNDVSEARLKSMAGGALKKTVPVSGAVTVDGSPAKGVNIYLTKVEGGEQVNFVRTDADGKYAWSTNLPNDGVEPGQYIVTFKYVPKSKKNEQLGEDLFKGKYANPTKSEYKLTVEADQPQTDVNYELTMSGAKKK
ncbi:MAG: carboxypeptidase-like regulatory domain-containing protein [Planctomycetaceae bacterium]